MQPQRLSDDLLHRHARVERGEGILKDDLQLAPELIEARPRGMRDLCPLVKHAPFAGGQQAQQQTAKRGFSGTGLADDRQRFARHHSKRNAIDRRDKPCRSKEFFRAGEKLAEVTGFKNGRGHAISPRAMCCSSGTRKQAT